MTAHASHFSLFLTLVVQFSRESWQKTILGLFGFIILDIRGLKGVLDDLKSHSFTSLAVINVLRIVYCQWLGELEETDYQDTLVLCRWRLSSRTWNPITSPWMKHLTWFRIVHSLDWCLLVVHAREEEKVTDFLLFSLSATVGYTYICTGNVWDAVCRVLSAAFVAGLCKSNRWSWQKYKDLPRQSGSAVWTCSHSDRSHSHREATSCTERPAGDWLGAVWWVNKLIVWHHWAALWLYCELLTLWHPLLSYVYS